jgi:hypothetical protein
MKYRAPTKYSVEQWRRLHGKISSCYTLGLYLRTRGYDMREEDGTVMQRITQM